MIQSPSETVPEACQNFHAIAMQPHELGDFRGIVRLRCKMWTCPYCAAKNRQIWRAKLIHHIAHNLDKSWAWFTLTAHSKMRGEMLSLKNLRGAWDTLLKRMKRKYGTFDYVRVYEKHQDGSYHIHAIVSLHFDDLEIRTSEDGTETPYSTWLQQTAEDLSLGWYTHADNIEDVTYYTLNKETRKLEPLPEGISVPPALKSGYIASYVTKYIVKLDVQTRQEMGRIRHIQTSQSWLIKPVIENEAEKWLFKFGVYYDDVAEAQGKYQFIDLNTQHIISFEDFEDTYIYPSEFAYNVDKP